jgi:uncharacterized membrane protein YcaP (DUF421 family)
MRKEDIHLGDIHRILFGQTPAAFLIEVFLRTFITYVTLLLLLKLFGKRMDGKITIIEMAIVVTLGAIVAGVFHLPDKGILQAITALFALFVIHRVVAWVTTRSAAFEKITQGSLSLLVKDGIMQTKEMEACGVTKENLFAKLRGQQITNLGKVKRVYFEVCGLLSVFEEPQQKPGLSVVPPELKKSGGPPGSAPGFVACGNCGLVVPASDRHVKCNNCGHYDWRTASMQNE